MTDREVKQAIRKSLHAYEMILSSFERASALGAIDTQAPDVARVLNLVEGKKAMMQMALTTF